MSLGCLKGWKICLSRSFNPGSNGLNLVAGHQQYFFQSFHQISICARCLAIGQNRTAQIQSSPTHTFCCCCFWCCAQKRFSQSLTFDIIICKFGLSNRLPALPLSRLCLLLLLRWDDLLLFLNAGDVFPFFFSWPDWMMGGISGQTTDDKPCKTRVSRIDLESSPICVSWSGWSAGG